VYTILHAGGKFGGGGYKVSGGLHGVGASVVNALSEWMEVYVKRGGHIYNQRYERGKVCYPLKVVGDCDENDTGTKVTFLPDKEIFQETQVFEFDRLREMAFLTKGIKIILKDEREGIEQERTFHYEGGLREFVEYLNKSKVPLYDNIIYCEGVKDNVQVEVAFQHNDGYNEVIDSFVNNINTHDGGTHEEGVRRALTRIINNYARKNNFLKDKDAALTGDDVKEGLS
jgi:DNA gyrase subunit B